MQVHSKPARLLKSLGLVAKTLPFSSAAKPMSRMAKPESIAEATKIGARMAVCQPSLAISRPKIHAVMEWTRIATGSAMRESTSTLRSSPFISHTMSKMLMMR